MEKISKYGIYDIGKVSRQCFYVGLVLGLTGIASLLFLHFMKMDLRQILPACKLYSMLGLYCPGCGGTRAFYALLQGKVLQSLLLHPLVVYFAVGYLVFMLSHMLDILTQGRIRGFYFCPYYWYVGIGILLVQFVAKDVLLLMGYDVLAGIW